MFRGRGIALKLALIFVVAGVVPMATLGFVGYRLARDSMTETSTEFFVQRVAVDTANNLDVIATNKREATRLLAWSTPLRDNVYELLGSAEGSARHDAALSLIRADLNNWVDVLGTVDLLAIVRPDGTISATNSRARPTRTGFFADTPPGQPRNLWDREDSNPLAGYSVANRVWWPKTAEHEVILIDSHREPLVIESYGYPRFLDEDVDKVERDRIKNPEAYTFAFAVGIPNPPGIDEAGGPISSQATLVAFHNWTAIQDHLDAVNESFAHHERYHSAYTFLFAYDANTIIAHYYRRLYDGKLVEDHGLADFRDAMVKARDRTGTYRYVYRKEKISGFAPVDSTGWEVGFGINVEDFNGPVVRLRNLIIGWSLGVAALIVVLVAFFSPRITRPIRELIAQAREIARGNLDARVAIDSHDEVQELGASFNAMAEELKESNKKLIEAEKRAAWQEMARQVAHEIKNPLTPIKLSAQLIEKAWRDEHPDFERILRDGVRNIVSQSDSLRQIAADFSDFASFPKRNLEPQRLLPLVESVVQLYSNREETGVEVSVEALAGADVEVKVDANELRRVFINLFNNALEAMPEGGRLTVSLLPLEDDEGRAVIDIRVKDTGCGIAPELTERLFEPYFTTRSSGTGLGLAIARKTIEGYGGTISLQSAVGEGTSVCITLPIHLG
ncbi:MAG: ATP-binding protein [Planctomycetota bacterium]